MDGDVAIADGADELESGKFVFDLQTIVVPPDIEVFGTNSKKNSIELFPKSISEAHHFPSPFLNLCLQYGPV